MVVSELSSSAMLHGSLNAAAMNPHQTTRRPRKLRSGARPAVFQFIRHPRSPPPLIASSQTSVVSRIRLTKTHQHVAQSHPICRGHELNLAAKVKRVTPVLANCMVCEWQRFIHNQDISLDLSDLHFTLVLCVKTVSKSSNFLTSENTDARFLCAKS